MNDPIAYFITWTTYGTWLPGDQRGWVKRGRWVVQPPNPSRDQQAREKMTEDVVVLTPEQRTIVDSVVVNHCRIRQWLLHARNARTNHVHVVVTALLERKVVREQLKAWASRRLSEAAGLRAADRNGLRRWWTEKGDIELVREEEHLSQIIKYVQEMQ
jgi:REP element-mobilizing transposase RayT